MRSKSRLNPAAERPATTALPSGRPPDDSWVDGVADEVTELLRERGLDLELLVMVDPITETLHGVGYDGSAARYFRSLESNPAASESPAPRGTPMENIQNPAATRHETNEEVGA